MTTLTRRTTSLALAGLSVLSLSAAALTSSPSTAHAASVDTASFTQPVYEAENDAKGMTFITVDQTEEQGAVAKYGYTHDLGEQFLGAKTQVAGTVAVHRLWKESMGFLYIRADDPEMQSVITKSGFVDQGTEFYASTNPATGLTGVYRLRSPQNRFYYTIDKADRDAKVAAGWGEGFISFYAAPVPAPATDSPFKGTTAGYAATQTMPEDINPAGDADHQFSIAVLPDTQEETSSAATWQKSSAGWQNYVNYITAHKTSDDIRMVTQVGDLNNWSEREPQQMTLTKSYLDKITGLGLPFTVDIGNHDSGAVGSNGGPATDTTYGGAAYVANPLCLTDPKIHSDPYLIALSKQLGYGGETCKTRVLVRQTDVTNAALPGTYLGREMNTWEPGKLDNSWSEFSAGGKKFAIMNLEFNARNEVVDWANQQVSAHPDINFIVSTHAYLNDDGSIRSDAEYGVNAGTDLTTKLISQHANIKAVISGHVGEYNSRVDTYNGNKVASFLQTMHRTNPDAPIRMLHIDTSTGSITSEIVNGADNSVYPNSATSVSGLDFV